ncbi:MAG: AMP-binding protein [Rickettsiales bacterium]|jgi:acyl-[acyl-carrier-protein]-phospholipid O-acyltransferase/long-chain-fatty-acid--[acyl-carrier-protein] ligase|nr:AMP-binding protein [Rickettsiales bacterium]
MKDLLKKNIKFFIIEFFTLLNESVFKNVLILLINFSIYDTVTISPYLLTLVSTSIFTIPQILFCYVAGNICDKYDKNYIVGKLKTFELFSYSFASISILLRSTPLLVLSLFTIAVQSVFFEIIKYSVVSEISNKNEYLKFNGLTLVFYFASWVLGILISYLCLLYHAGGFTISIILMTTVIINYTLSKQLKYQKHIKNNGITIRQKVHFIASDIKSLLFVAKRKYLFLTGFGIAWFWFVVISYMSQLHSFATEYLNTNEVVALSFIVIFVFGIFSGVLACFYLFKDKINIGFTPIPVIIVTLLTYTVFENNVFPNAAQTVFDFSTFFAKKGNIWLLVNFFLIGLFSAIYVVPLYSFLSLKTKSINRGRIFSGINFLNNLFVILSCIMCYVLSQKNFYVIDIFLFVAIANLLVGFYIMFLLPRSVILLFGKWLFKWVFSVKVKGIENYKAVQDKRIIIIANHQSFLDPLLLSMFIEDELSFAVAVHTHNTWYLRPFLKLANCFIMDSTNPMALKGLINMSRSGKKIMIFPEGRITTTGTMMKIYEGPAMVAEKSGALLVPVRIEGAQYTIFSRLKNKVRRRLSGDITLTVMPAQKIMVPNDTALSARQRRVEAGNQLHKIMLDLFYSLSKSKETLFEALLKSKKKFGSNHKIIEDTSFKPQTYKALILKSFVLGNFLSKFTQQKEYVGILLPNAVANVVLFFAMQSRDRIPVMLNFSAGVRNILIACNSTRTKYVFTSRLFIEKARLENVVEALKNDGINVIILEDQVNNITLKDKLSALLFSKFPKIAYRRLTKGQVTCDDTAAVLFTSGSENLPKGVALSHFNFSSNRHQLLCSHIFNPSDIIFCCLPLFHAFGFGATLISIIAGTKVFFYPSPLHYRIIPELVYRTNSTIMFATNTFLERYARFANPFDFYSLRFIAVGGEKLTEKNKLVWSDRYGVKLFEGYGATETAPLIAFNSPMKYKFGTVGTFVPGIEYRLEKIEGIEEGGRLFLKGDNVFKGYIMLDKPCEIIPPKDGWYDTGDIASVDKDGYVKIIGRAKRFAKISGEMVSMLMVENEVNKIWPDNTNAILAEKDEKKGEKLTIVTNREDASIHEVVDFFHKNGLAEISIPKRILYIKDIPLLGTGKINYVELEKIIFA